MKVKLNTTLKFDEHLIPGGTILIDDDIPQVILDLVEQNSPHVELLSAAIGEMSAPIVDHDVLDEIIADPDVEEEAEELTDAEGEEDKEDVAVSVEVEEDSPKLKRRGK